jgi:hypothetical protein
VVFLHIRGFFDIMDKEQVEHILTIESLKKLTATGISSVDSFSASQIVMSYSGGKIVVNGSQMKITAFSKSTGSFSASGVFSSVKYGGGSGLRQKLLR